MTGRARSFTLFGHVDVCRQVCPHPALGVALMTRAQMAIRPLVAATATLILGLVALGCIASAVAVGAARAARTLNVTDEAHLRLAGTSGSTLIEEGPASGALPGTVRVRFTVGASISGSFTIYPRGGGSISGQGSARLHSTGTYASFGGSMSVSHGTGRYAHAHGRGGFYGTVNRNTDALVIQTTGRLAY
jgi:hypothetical protein